VTETVGHIYVNGYRVEEKTELKLYDRVVFGHSAFFLFRYKKLEKNAAEIDKFDWAFS